MKRTDYNTIEILKKIGLYNPTDSVYNKISFAIQAIEKAREALGKRVVTSSEVINYWTNENS